LRLRAVIACEKVVIAGGAWTSQVINEALPNPRIEPIRGQMVSFDATPQIARHVIYSPHGYLVPRRDGRLLAGSTTEHAGFDKRVTAAGVQSIVTSRLRLRRPSQPCRSRPPGRIAAAGRRRLPVSSCAEIAGVFYATGHYRNGIY